MPGHHHLSMQLRLVHSYTLLPSSHIHGRLAETISLVVRDATSAGPAPALLSTLQTEPPLNPPENRENTAEIFFEVRKAFSRFSRDLASRQRCPCQIRTSSLLSVPPPLSVQTFNAAGIHIAVQAVLALASTWLNSKVGVQSFGRYAPRPDGLNRLNCPPYVPVLTLSVVPQTGGEPISDRHGH